MSPLALRGEHAAHVQAYRGRVRVLDVESACLAGNALGDPARRGLWTYAPPGDADDEAALPLFLVLPGFTGNGQSWFDPHALFPGWIALLDERIATGAFPRVRLAVPDCLTRLGGSQYVDSPAVGAYETHLMEELLPLLEARFPGSRGRVGLLGKSSGGFGALRLAMHHPGCFQAVGSISGDCAFDQHFPAEFLACLRGLQAFEGDPRRVLAALGRPARLAGDAHAVLYVLACAACYSPDPAEPAGFALPFTRDTGELVPAVWERWLAFDPLRLVAEHAPALAGLRTLWIECGLADEFHLQWGTRRLARALRAAGVAHEHVEHAGGHRGIDERYAVVIEHLAAALA